MKRFITDTTRKGICLGGPNNGKWMAHHASRKEILVRMNGNRAVKENEHHALYETLGEYRFAEKDRTWKWHAAT